MIGTLIFDRYKLIKKLGSGSFGSIYSAEYENNYYAIKLEEKSRGQNLLENEAYIMSYLNGPRIPVVKSFGYSGDHNVLIMELMGKSLEDLFENLPNKKMSIRCVCNLGYQMIDIMEFIHNKHIIHRDIKPDNFVMGKGAKSKYLFLLDFGLSKKYRSSTTLKHYPLIKRKKLTGTARYASINALNGMTQSRRDDLEAIGYVLMYFLIGKLPWQGMVNKNKDERYLRIMEVKRDTTPEQLCRGFPPEFERYISYTRNLEYEEDPDYNLLKNLFLKVLKDEGYNLDYYYDWDIDVTTMTTDDTNKNLNYKNELNNKDLEKKLIIKQINENNVEENELKKDKNQHLNNKDFNFKIITEEKENNDKNENEIDNDNDNENEKNENKNIDRKGIKADDGDNAINPNKEKSNHKENIENKNIIGNDDTNKIGNNDKGKNIDIKNEEIILDRGLIQNGKIIRRHNKYMCGYKNNEDNKCCIIF